MRVKFYRNKNGNMPVLEWMNELRKRAKNDKNARIQIEKIDLYIGILSERGTRAGEKVTKKISDDIWELRPTDNRILFFLWDGKAFILLHYFTKKTQKTPQKEIEKAISRMNDFKERMRENNE